MVSNKAQKSAEKFMADFEKMFGQNSLKVAGYPHYETFSTGSISLDKAMGAGGYIQGRVTMLWGPASGGKSSLSLIAAGLAQQKQPEKRVVYIDVEKTFDGAWAETLGVDLSRMDIVVPRAAEDVADMVKQLTGSGIYSMVILDSIGAMVSMKEFEKNAEEATVGIVAKIVTRMMNISIYNIMENDVAFLIINQLRANIGGYGVAETSGGGFNLEHSLTSKLYIKRGSAPYTVGSNEEKRNVGYEMVVKVQKSKVCPEGRVARFGFFTEATDKYGPVGIDKAQEAFTLGVAQGTIVQGGAYYTFPDGVKVQGKEAAVEKIRTEPALIEDIRAVALKAVEHELKEIDEL